MKKLVMLAGALAFAGTLAACQDEAKAQELPAALTGLGIELNNDISYNIDTEVATAEPEIVVSAYGAQAYASTPIDIEEVELGNIEVGLSYGINILDGVALVPYVEGNFTDSFDHIDTVVGIRTSVKLF